jgi:signal transduction histidine kinase/phage shock protein PspC (stress-responsive transcriptional regulator)
MRQPLRRDLDHAVVAGVLAGVARRLRVDAVIVRVVFVIVAVATGGIAIPAYGIAWLSMPGNRSGTGRRSRRTPRILRGWRVAIGVGLLTLAALLAFRELGIWWSDPLVWPLVLAASGVALLWHQTRRSVDEPEAEASSGPREAAPARTEERAPRSQFAQLYSGGFGIALVIGAALLFLSSNNVLGAARDAAFTAIVVLIAFALILAPFLWRLGRNLATERAERIRSQERAELAAHLHDSVLQTLTLMQKRADEPREVAALARRQERELRGWLYGDRRPQSDSLTAALREAAESVEDAHGVAIEVVSVGDRPLDEHCEALVAAAREALTNAAKFAPDDPVSLYSEVENGRVQVFVHDRGPGFDVAGVPDDRRGVRDSIIARMRRHGGTATIRSTPGEGTEVELTLEGKKET